MVNNIERIDPFGDDPASVRVHGARRSRGLSALDEGQAWRHRDNEALVVVRHERFEEIDDTEHRTTWRREAEEALEATWRSRWMEREVEPGWIEARWVGVDERPDRLHVLGAVEPVGVAAAVDWVRVEDHTDPSGGRAVTMYEHLTVWVDRSQATVVVRHPVGLDLAQTTEQAAVHIHQLLGSYVVGG